MSTQVIVVDATITETRRRFWELLAETFSDIPLERLQEGFRRLPDETRFFAVASEQGYLSALFVAPIRVSGMRFGGIGGVCTRENHRGSGLGRLVLNRALAETVDDYRALLLWTRIPRYFSNFGFVEVSQLFVPDPEGSTPMMHFNDGSSAASILSLSDLPREYF
jgi:N-acetylglutamate synthase-like GNAT family acetyltransferase